MSLIMRRRITTIIIIIIIIAIIIVAITIVAITIVAITHVIMVILCIANICVLNSSESRVRERHSKHHIMLVGYLQATCSLQLSPNVHGLTNRTALPWS